MWPGNFDETDKKLYAFCQGAVAELYPQRKRIGGRYFAYCHVLGELTLRYCRVPSMRFLPPERRSLIQQELCETARQAFLGIDTDDNVSRDAAREVIGLAVADFRKKPKAARDLEVAPRGLVRTPDFIACQRLQQDYPHDYRAFINGARERVLRGLTRDERLTC